MVGARIRTSDPVVPNDVRYQAALRPEPDHHPPVGWAGEVYAAPGCQARRAARAGAWSGALGVLYGFRLFR